MAKVTLIRPPALSAKWVPAVIATPPLGLAYLAGTLTHHAHAVQVIDAVGEAIDEVSIVNTNFSLNGLPNEAIVERVASDTGLIGITSMFSQEWPNVRDLIQQLKKRFPSVPIVCGGEHVTAEPVFSLESCPELDFCVLGEGEDTLFEMSNALSKGASLGGIPGVVYQDQGKILTGPKRSRIKNIDEIPWPRWDLTPIENYLKKEAGFGVKRGRSIPMLLSRGCPYQCTFCSSPVMWTTRWNVRAVDDVVREIETYKERYDISNLDFYDLTAIIRKDWIVQFANKLGEKNLGISWHLPSGTRSEAIDKEVCEAMYRSGCKNVSYAPESGSPAVLKRIKKRVNIERLISSMSDAINTGINTKINMIIGFPEETYREIWQTLGFLARCAWIGVHDMSMWIFSPYPGSELFTNLKAKDRINFSDDYFYSLSAYSDYSQAISWNDKMGPRSLKFYRFLATAIFYSLSYLFHPMRLIRTFRNIFSGKHESRLETVLEAALQRYLKRLSYFQSAIKGA